MVNGDGRAAIATFWAAGEDQLGASVDRLNVFRSDNFGRNFRVVGVVPTRTTGHITGVGDVLYVQAWTRNQYPSRLNQRKD